MAVFEIHINVIFIPRNASNQQLNKEGIEPANSYEFPSNSLAELTLSQAWLANLSQDNSGECR
jgi:hypothetical protein